MPQRMGRPSRAPHEGHGTPDELRSHVVGHLVSSTSLPSTWQRGGDRSWTTVLRACDDPRLTGGRGPPGEETSLLRRLEEPDRQGGVGDRHAVVGLVPCLM